MRTHYLSNFSFSGQGFKNTIADNCFIFVYHWYYISDKGHINRYHFERCPHNPCQIQIEFNNLLMKNLSD